MNRDFSALCDLVADLRDLRLREEERLRCTHGRFNVFTTVLAAHDEVRLHTRFLHLLLNPEGNHDCDDLFLDLFWRTIAESGVDAHDGAAVAFPWIELCSEGPWRVLKETSPRNCDGQIDLLLESKRTIVVVENKIYAGEQGRQLSRYAGYCASRTDKRSIVVYLTLDGKQAISHEGCDYARLSYERHIRHWLDSCLRGTYSIIPINQVLLQYRSVIDQLTGNDTTEAAMTTVVEFLKSHPEVVAHYPDISNGVEALRNETMDRFIESLQEALAGQFHTALRADIKGGRFSSDPFGDLVIRRRSDDISSGHAFEIWIEYISKWDALVIGIEGKWGKQVPERSGEPELLAKMNDRLTEMCERRGWHKARPQQSFGGTYWPTGWHDIFQPFVGSHECLADMQSPSAMKSKVLDAVDAIGEHMDMLDSCYRDVANGE